MERAMAPCSALISSASSACFAESSTAASPSACFFRTSPSLKYLDAASVQSALGSITPPALITKSSMSVGMITTFAPFGNESKPGARFLDCASATFAQTSTTSASTTAMVLGMQSPLETAPILARLYVAHFQADVHERLPLIFPYDFQRPLERRHQLRRLGDALAVSAACADDVLEARRGLEGGKRGLVPFRSKSLRIGRQRRAVYRSPARVVRDDEEHGQAHRLRDVVRSGRIAEHVGAVADGADHGLVGRGELDAERRTHAPAEAAGGGIAEVVAGLLDHHLLEHRRVLVHEDGVGLEPAVHAGRQPLAGDARWHGIDAGRRVL